MTRWPIVSMRATQFLIATEKETPADAVVISHKLMLRSGMIRKLAAGLYTWMPLGLRTLPSCGKNLAVGTSMVAS